MSADWPPPEYRLPEPVAPEPPPPTAERPAVWLAATILLVLAFVVGVLVGQSGALGGLPAGLNPPSGSGASAVAGSGGPSASANADTTDCKTGAFALAAPQLPAEAPSDFSLFWQALACIRQNYVGRGQLTDQQLTYGAIRGMMEALGDTAHSVFLTPDDLASEQQSLNGTVVGIGALLGENNGVPIIVSVLGGGPADKAGIKAGDQIMSVDGQKVTSLGPAEVASKVRGPEGSQVVVDVFRPSTSQQLEFKMTRQKLSFPSASWAFIPGTHIADLRLIEFSTGAADDLRQARDQAVAQGATAFVLDLRSNPGGYVPEAVKTASLFLDHKTVYIRELASGERIPVASDDSVPPTNLPLIVLMDQGTASAAEIVAAGLGGNNRAQLLGDTTFGTGTVLLTFNLADGSAVRVAVERWLTPDGQLIFGQGVKPTVQLSMPATGRALEPQEISQLAPQAVATMVDAQMLKALQLLQAGGAT